MNKAEFLEQLRKALDRLPHYDREQSVSFYSEMIDDRIEDGMTEAEAVASLGYINEIAAQIIAETPLVPKTIAKAKTGSRTLNIVLLIIFAPIWIPIAIAILAVIISVYFAIWAVIVSLWAAILAFFAAGLAALVAAVYLLATGFPLTALLGVGLGLISIGLGLFCFFGVLAASKGLFNLTKLFARKVMSLFVKEGSSS